MKPSTPAPPQGGTPAPAGTPTGTPTGNDTGSQTGENVCPGCAGRGRLEDGRACPTCGGSGRVTEPVGDA